MSGPIFKVPESADSIHMPKRRKSIVKCNNCIYYIQFESVTQWDFWPKMLLTGKGLNKVWKEKNKNHW